MGGIFPGGDECVLQQTVDEDLDVLAGNRASAGKLGDGLRAEMVEATQNAAAAGREFALAVDFGRNRAKSVEEGGGFVEEAGEGGSETFLHDYYNVIMTSLLSIELSDKCGCGR